MHRIDLFGVKFQLV